MDLSVARFIEAVTALPADTLATVYEESLDRWPHGGRDVSRAAAVSASENSAIQHAVRVALLERVHDLDKAHPGLRGGIKSACCIAARAVIKRAKLTEVQYRLLLDPFTAVGVPVPARDA
ncbi:hypothetical protein [Streptomyces sp. NPDC058620]|uniref:hypothetical protein n=1 Tax=Streptomyces sp. NPDC058620 TaxID=3346560 RepID=UPI0036665FAF